MKTILSILIFLISHLSFAHVPRELVSLGRGFEFPGIPDFVSTESQLIWQFAARELIYPVPNAPEDYSVGARITTEYLSKSNSGSTGAVTFHGEIWEYDMVKELIKISESMWSLRTIDSQGKYINELFYIFSDVGLLTEIRWDIYKEQNEELFLELNRRDTDGFITSIHGIWPFDSEVQNYEAQLEYTDNRIQMTGIFGDTQFEYWISVENQSIVSFEYWVDSIPMAYFSILEIEGVVSIVQWDGEEYPWHNLTLDSFFRPWTYSNTENPDENFEIAYLDDGTERWISHIFSRGDTHEYRYLRETDPLGTPSLEKYPSLGILPLVRIFLDY